MQQLNKNIWPKKYIYICVCVCISVYIYIYIYNFSSKYKLNAYLNKKNPYNEIGVMMIQNIIIFFPRKYVRVYAGGPVFDPISWQQMTPSISLNSWLILLP